MTTETTTAAAPAASEIDYKHAVEAMKARAIRAELERQGAKDPESLEALIAKQTTVNERGEILAVTGHGAIRVGNGPDYNMGCAELIAEFAKERPGLFVSKAEPAETKGRPQRNPFQAGPGFSMTEQMVLIKSNPKLAEQLAFEAGLNLGVL
ncbi:hypothetical protein [Methylobacterium symbioticum]|uniref:Uncharacterized protein n=1 Tax=Methylobacterium symbioticum TaxID=2584084 RepID=A0A509E7B8_9HYPH|nr:hypothetical protein [Methylobacterium symbioticum]VUD70028.1 hypothetical protein MET9862_00589 [Methylobacterium symbioticum]